LPELLKSEVFTGLYQRLEAQNKRDLEALANEVRESLAKMDERSKDIQQYLLNQATRAENK
jgi:hypothetical protein